MGANREQFVTVDPSNPHTLELVNTGSDPMTLSPDQALALADDLIAGVKALASINADGLHRAETIAELAMAERAPRTPARARGARA